MNLICPFCVFGFLVVVDAFVEVDAGDPGVEGARTFLSHRLTLFL